ADVPAMSVTIHCEHGHRYGEPRSECTVLLCCARHVQLSVHRIMRLSRERPLRPRAYTFVARSDRTFELNLWDRRGRRSGLDKPEALVDLLYKYEVAKNQRDDVPLPFTSFYRWPSFFRDIRPAEWLWAETYAYPYGSDQEYLSLNWIWKQTELDAGLEEIVYPLMEYYREVDSDTAPLTPKWSWHGPNALPTTDTPILGWLVLSMSRVSLEGFIKSRDRSNPRSPYIAYEPNTDRLGKRHAQAVL
ncbi:hypothetical protein FOZ62_012005, partial [Perkinsus olseni]